MIFQIFDVLDIRRVIHVIQDYTVKPFLAFGRLFLSSIFIQWIVIPCLTLIVMKFRIWIFTKVD